MGRNLLENARAAPGNAQAWFALGLAALEADRLDEAGYALVCSVQLAPGEVDRALLAAARLADRQAFPAAEEILRLLVRGQPERSDLRVRLCQLLIAAGDARGALVEVNRALDEDPDSAELRLQAAACHEGLGELDEAAQHLGAILAKRPAHREANRQLGVLLCRTGKGAEGAAHLERAARSGGQPLDGEAATLLAIERSQQGRHAEAIDLLRAVVAGERDDGPAAALSDALSNLGMALLAGDEVAEALDVFQGAFDRDAGSAQATCGLGLAYQKLGQWPEAAEAFRATERLAPVSPIGPLNLGLALEQLGDLAGARRALQRATELAPGDGEIARALAELPTVLPVREAAAPAGRPGRVGPCMAGDLQTFDLAQVLEFLQVQRKTGSLVLSSPQGAGIVRLFQGEITSASAPGAGALLDSLARMSGWSEGGFSFHPTTPGEPPATSYNVQQVLLELARQADERRARGSG